MLNFRYITLVISLLFLFSGCKKETLDTYKSKSSIYFSNAALSVAAATPFDSLAVSFGYKLPDVTSLELKIPVGATGIPAGHDRHFKISIDDGHTAESGKEYKALEDSYVFGAGKTIDTVIVVVYRTMALKSQHMSFVLHLQAGEDFNTDLQSADNKFLQTPTTPDVSYVKLRIILDDMVEEPVYWQVSFGKFTPKKFYLMCDLSGLQPAFFNTISGLNVYTVINAGVLLTRYLAEQKAAGTPVLYEDGTEMRTDDY